ncbi:MAG: ABC-type transport auxiliary lipoprotein family protein, partial [Nitrospirae bacterium]|nr:ABC-type transport auxiliary lipoprotein family protein [Nitrospirota bacterium]
MMTSIRLGIVVGIGIVSLALSGCLSLPHEERQIQTFYLSLDRSAGGASTLDPKPKTGILVVNVPVAQPGFDTPRMAYTQRPFEVRYYATHQWADSPSRMVTPVLIQALEQTGYWRAIVPMPTSVRGDHRVEMDQLALVQDFLQKPSQLHLTLRVQLIKLPEHLVLGTRLFDAAEVASSDDAYGGAVAA